MSIFEAIMLLCFGAAWPFSIYKSWVSKSSEGKSMAFMIIVEVGYISGMIHKVLYSRDGVLYLYALNTLLVLVDMILYYRNKRLARHVVEVCAVEVEIDS